MVCDHVLEQRERGVALREQAVLFRTGHHSDGLELELARRNIPFVKFGGLKFLESAHVKDRPAGPAAHPGEPTRRAGLAPDPAMATFDPLPVGENEIGADSVAGELAALWD